MYCHPLCPSTEFVLSCLKTLPIIFMVAFMYKHHREVMGGFSDILTFNLNFKRLDKSLLYALGFIAGIIFWCATIVSLIIMMMEISSK